MKRVDKLLAVSVHGEGEVVQGEVLHIQEGQLEEFMSLRVERLLAVSME